MENVLDEVEKRTNLAFTNQMEMLTFYLSDAQQYGINVFKIIEVIETPKVITKIPGSHPAVIGGINFRGRMVTVIDISLGLGLQRVNHKKEISYVMVCEYSNSTQGFLVAQPNRLMTVSWQDIKAPGGHMHDSGYLTALTYDENDQAVQILDVEKILGEIIGIDTKVTESLIEEGRKADMKNLRVLVLDDSKVARTMLKTALDQLDVPCDVFEEGHLALQSLQESLRGNEKRYCLIISDIEMPGMDGFTFTRKVKENDRLAKIHLVLHSSMSNKANRAKAQSVGADGFIPKFQPDEIAKLVLDRLNAAKDKDYCQSSAA